MFNSGGLGDPEKVGREYLRDEIIPVCELMMDEIKHDPEIASRRELQVMFDLGLPG